MKSLFGKSTAIVILGLLFSQWAYADIRAMVCRGGSDGRNNIEIGMNTLTHNMLSITYDFQKYTGSVSNIKPDGSHLQPGQCSWDDNVMASNWNGWFDHQITPFPNAILRARFTPGRSGSSLHTQQNTSVWFSPDSNDPNQRYLPQLPGNNGGYSLVRGSILDSDYVFHLWVERNGDHLRLVHLGLVNKVF